MMVRTIVKTTLGTGLLLAFFTVVPAATAVAQTSTTVPCSGSGGGSAGLVSAINAANSGGGGTITLASSCTYSLTSADNGTATGQGATGANGLPVIVSTISIVGSSTTISANNTDFRIFEVDGPNGNLTLQGLTLSGGNSLFGGAILNVEGSVTATQVLVTGNTASMGGGGIASGVVNPAHLGPIGTLTLNNSQVNGNTATSSGGGGILNHAGTLTLNSSQVNNNNSAGGGGGIASGSGNGGAAGSASLIVNNSEVNNNTATGGPMSGAGGIANGSMATITGSQIEGNSAPGGDGGGILNHGTMTITSSDVNNNAAPTDSSGNEGNGGGIANFNLGPAVGAPSAGQLTVSQSQIEGNSTTGSGGAIDEAGFNPAGVPLVAGGALNIVSSQVTGNASGSGGGIEATPGSPITFSGSGSSIGKDSTTDCAGTTGNAAFLCAAYEYLVERAPDAAGSSAFEKLLSKGVTRTQVAFDIAASTEYRTDFVTYGYEAFLGRAPDAGGLQTQLRAMARGYSDQQILADLIGSPEFYTDAGGTSAGFVTALYGELLGRAPDSAGLSSWESELASGTSRTVVAERFIVSKEFLSSLIGVDYLSLLDRPVDAVGLSTWVSDLTRGISYEMVLAGIIGGPEFYAVST